MDHANKEWLGIKPRRMSETAKAVIAAVALIAAYALVGTLEYNDLVAEQNEIQVCRVQS